MKNCKGCSEKIPNKITIAGRVRHLNNRKYCLKCSPWNGPDRSENLTRKTSKKYSEFSEERKKKNISSVLKRGTERKKKLIELAGGGCVKCGYDKCDRALSFHHRDRKEKVFGLAKNNLWSKSWDKILVEFNKCDLLCLNCHSEIEHELSFYA